MQKILIIGAGPSEKAAINKLLMSHPEIEKSQVEFMDGPLKSMPTIKEKELIFEINKEVLVSDVFESQNRYNKKLNQNVIRNFKVKLPEIFKTTKKFASIRNKLWRK